MLRFPVSVSTVAEGRLVGIVVAVWVGLALHLILVDRPIERGARDEPVREGLCRNPGQRQRFIDGNRLLGGAQLSFSSRAPSFDNRVSGGELCHRIICIVSGITVSRGWEETGRFVTQGEQY